jgi:hypothetical protein
MKRSVVIKAIKKLNLTKINEVHDLMFPNNEPEELEEFPSAVRIGIERYARNLIIQIRDTSKDNTEGDDIEGYVYEALRINFLCGLAIGLEEGKKSCTQ